MRNVHAHLDRYNAQLAGLRNQRKGEYEVFVSIYENDSTDGTAERLKQIRDAGALHNHFVPNKPVQSLITTAKLGTTQYPSIWSLDRIRNLANARQACLDQVGDLSRFDKIAYIEPDVFYDSKWAVELILARHPHAAGLGEPDIYSGWSLRTEAHPKESTYLYDTCATRQTSDCREWSFEKADTWRAASLVPTNLDGRYDGNCLHRVYSAFNCFCVYNARPFIEGVKWGFINKRLNTGQAAISEDFDTPLLGWLDADTSVMCESFRERGYNGVYLNTNCLVRHL